MNLNLNLNARKKLNQTDIQSKPKSEHDSKLEPKPASDPESI